MLRRRDQPARNQASGLNPQRGDVHRPRHAQRFEQQMMGNPNVDTSRPTAATPWLPDHSLVIAILGRSTTQRRDTGLGRFPRRR